MIIDALNIGINTILLFRQGTIPGLSEVAAFIYTDVRSVIGY